MAEQTQVAAPITQAPAAPATPAAIPTLAGSADQAAATSLTQSAPAHPVTPAPLEIDKRLRKEDGTFNEDGYKEFIKEKNETHEKYEKRILDLRRTISKGNAPEKKEEYFQDYAPEERFMKFFDEKAENAEDMKQIQEVFGQTYFDAGLNREQANKMSNAFCGLMEGLGIFDTRSDAQKIQAKIDWITEQKKALGSNADNIIREARTFIDNAPIFSAKTKNALNKMMDEQGAPFVDTIYQMKEAYGGGAGGQVPSASIAGLGSLPSDGELKEEYMRKGTTDYRRQEIIQLRARAGRTGKLMDA